MHPDAVEHSVADDARRESLCALFLCRPASGGNQRAVLTAATAAFACFSVATARAAISYTGAAHVQDFNGFTGVAGNVAFSNDTTLTGLYAYISDGANTGDAVAGVPDIFAHNSGNTTTATAITT